MSDTAPNTRRPGRPTSDSGPVISRAELLGIATRMITADGFDATTVRGLAHVAGVSLGTVQHHFPTKRALWEAIVDEVIVPRVRTRRALLVSQGLASVGESLRARMEAIARGDGMASSVLFDNSEASADRLVYLAQALADEREAGRRALEGMVAAGEIRDVDLDVLEALYTVGLPALATSRVAMAALFGLDVRDDATRERIAETTADLLLHGLLPR